MTLGSKISKEFPQYVKSELSISMNQFKLWFEQKCRCNICKSLVTPKVSPARITVIIIIIIIIVIIIIITLLDLCKSKYHTVKKSNKFYTNLI